MRRSIFILHCSIAAIALATSPARADDPSGPSAPGGPGAPAADVVVDGGAAGTHEAPPEAADPNAPTVGASLDRTEAHVGDRLTVTVTAIARDAVAPSVHLTRLDLGKFELLDKSEGEADLGDGKKSRRFVLQITAYELGELDVP